MSLLGIGEAALAIYGGAVITKKVISARGKIPPENAIGKITMRGPILGYQSTSSPLGSKSNITPDYVSIATQSLIEDFKVRGLIFEIDSPGGMVVPSKEIGDMIKAIDIPTIALVRGCAASGGYWAASACDKIVANSLSTIGSIGVILSHLNYHKLAEKLGVEYDGLKAGDHKDMGNSFRDFTPEEREILQKHIDKTHEVFMREIALNRKLPIEEIRKLATGLTYDGEDALESKLIDELGGQEEAIALIEEAADFKHTEVIEYKEKSGFITRVISRSASMCGESFFQGAFNVLARKQLENKIDLY